MIKTHLYLVDEGIVLIRLQGLIWASNGLLLNSQIRKSSVSLLKYIYENVEIDKPVVINCERVTEIGDRALDNFLTEVNSKERTILFLKPQLTDLDNKGVEKSNRTTFEKQLQDILSRLPVLNHHAEEGYYLSLNRDTIANIRAIVQTVENKFLKASIKSCYIPFGKETSLISSSILATGEFNAAYLIAKPKEFHWISQMLTDEVQRLIKDIQNKFESSDEETNYPDIKLLAVSLRGSPFASAIGLLSNLGYDTIDHLGPKHKLFDIEVLQNIKPNTQYIYIGDFAVGGTEIKIAQTYANLLGCFLENAVVIGSLLNPKAFRNHFRLKTLVFFLDKEIRPEATYSLPLAKLK